MWSSGLLWLSFALCYSNSFAISNVSEASCHANDKANRQLGALESHVELLETAIKSLKMKVSNFSDISEICGERLPCSEPENVTCPVCPKTVTTTPGYPCPTQTPQKDHALPMDCAGHMEAGYKKSGIYRILPIHSTIDAPFEVYCDMETDGGGWTVFQRRDDYGEPRQDFYLDWYSYKRGFGNLSKEFWLGNESLYALTNQKKVLLRVDLEDFEGERRYAEYTRFFVDSERALYTATFGTYRGDAGDSLGNNANNMAFSTKDKDNDTHAKANCAIAYKGGWWYSSCLRANLNGLYLKGKHESYADGIEWYAFKGYHYSLKFSEMKIRPVDYKSPFLVDEII